MRRVRNLGSKYQVKITDRLVQSSGTNEGKGTLSLPKVQLAPPLSKKSDTEKMEHFESLALSLPHPHPQKRQTDIPHIFCYPEILMVLSTPEPYVN